MLPAPSVLADGTLVVFGLWSEQTKGASVWLKLSNEFKALGVHDVLIALVDRLTGVPDAIEMPYPRTTA